MNESTNRVRKIDEVPPPFRSIFSEYPCFNIVQSKVLDCIFDTDKSLVVSAPTGSGKTVIFELAIVKLLHSLENLPNEFKIVYISPIKALCQERMDDWQRKFSPFGLNVVSITGDSDRMDLSNLGYHNLIISTPEKWDCLTRKWRENQKTVDEVKLFMIDEVHLLNEDSRGSTLEVIVSRMKTVEHSLRRNRDDRGIRFMAVSATIPNVEDIAEWIGKRSNVEYFQFSEEVRPVKLKKIVIGYNYNTKTMTPFKFDLSLNYKLQFLMMQHAEGKPTLIFCSTRKSVEMTAKHLVQNVRIQLSPAQSQKLCDVASMITDVKTKETIKHGIGFHHAGLIPETRHIIEDTFRKGDLPILVTTSTLAMGVNLPAHLVIVKSTKCYDKCGFRDYSETAMHQMIGRAGRPQFDTDATVLILTTKDDQEKFERMLGCSEPVESNLHRHLTEHLNAEIVLGTITDLEVAMQWLTSTFLYVRAMKNPRHYGLPMVPSKTQIEQKLLEICQIDLNKLMTAGMITMDPNIVITPTTIGKIMARYYIAFETMKLFTQISGREILMQILALISRCREFADIHLRVNDKKPLNFINKPSNKNRIRFPLNGKIKSGDMKVNCIIQAVLGNQDIPDSSILNDSFTIMRNGERLTKCLIEYLGTRRTDCFDALLNAIILGKCFHAKLWEDSSFLTKQLGGIGSVLSTHLANAGITSFEKLLASNPRNIEMIIKKKPPFGDYLMEEVRHIPRYEMELEKDSQGNPMQFKLMIRLLNRDTIQETSTVDIKSAMILLVGTSHNEIIFHERYQHSYMIENSQILKKFKVNKCIDLEKIEAHFISEDWVGIDCHSELVLKESPIETMKPLQKRSSKTKDVSNPTYTQMFLDMYMKIKKPLRKDQKNVSRSKELNVVDSTEKNRREKTNCNETGEKSSKSDKCHMDQSNLPNSMPDVDERVVEIVEEVAGSNDNFRFMSENLDIINASSDNECDKPVDIENSFEIESYQLVDADGTNGRDNGETSMKNISPHCDTISNDIEYWKERNEGRNNNLLKSFQRSLSFGRIETCTNERNSMEGNTDLKDPPVDRKSDSSSKDDNLTFKSGEVKPDSERNDRFLNTSIPCPSNHYSETRYVENSTYQIDFPKTKSDTNTIILTPSVNKKLSQKIVPTSLDNHIDNSHGLLSISQQYVHSSPQECFDFKDDNRLFNVRIGRDIDYGRKHSHFTRTKQKQDIANIHPAEDSEDKIFKEEPRKLYLHDFKKPEKKKIRHYFSDHNFPDSTMKNMIPVIGIIEEKTKGQKLYNIDSLHEHDDISEYTKKSIKWRSPLVSSPALKFSPKIDSFRTTGLNGKHNDVKEAFDISIISNNSRQTEDIRLNSKPTQSQPKQAFKTSQQQRGTKFPLCDNDYDGISESLTSKEFYEICETSFLEDMRTRCEKQIPKMCSQDETCSATDYIRQFMNKSSADTEKQLGKQGCQKSPSLSNVISNDNRKIISPYIKHEPKRNDVSQSLFDSQDYISYCREDSENKLFGPDHMEMYQKPMYSQQIDMTTERQQQYYDLTSREHNNIPIQEMSDGWPVHPSTSASHFAQPQYNIPYINDNNVNLIRSPNPGFKPRCHGLKCYQLRPYTFQNAHAYSVDSDHLKYSRPKPPGNYNYSLRSPEPQHHFDNYYQLKQPLSACPVEYFSQGDLHDARHRMKTPFEKFVGDQESMEFNRISERAALRYDIYNKPILDQNFDQYPDVNLLGQQNHIARDLNGSFVRDTCYPTNTENYNPNVGYAYDTFHNCRNSDYHGRNFIGHPRNLSRSYLHPRDYDQSFSSLDDKGYVMNKFMYSLYPQ